MISMLDRPTVKICRCSAVLILLFYWTAFLPSIFCPQGCAVYCIMSGSMEPVIHTGSLVYAEPSPTYCRGDIITYYSGKTAFTHRIVDIQNGCFITKGDANPVPDMEPVGEEQITGKIKELPFHFYCLPYIGYIQMILRECRGMLFITAGMLLAVSIILERKIGMEIKD